MARIHRICTFSQRSFRRKRRVYFLFFLNGPTAHVRTAFMGLFVGLGGGVFHVWEDWDLIEATYFSYVTLTTIGRYSK